MKHYKIKQVGNDKPVIVDEITMNDLHARTEKFDLIEEVDENGMNPTEAAAFKAALAKDSKKA